MDIFQSAWFTRFARKEKNSAAALHDAVVRAERGLIDADLGAGVTKQRIARPCEGRSKPLMALVNQGHFEKVVQDA